MGHTRTHRRFSTATLGLCLLPYVGSCRDNEGVDTAQGPGDTALSSAGLIYRRVPGAPFELEVPSGWRLEPVSPGTLPPPPTATTVDDAGVPASPEAASSGKPLTLQSRVLLSARAPKHEGGARVSAWLMVQHDPWLPSGTTASDYLAAQRASNRAAVADLRHVEAEFSRRQGRPAYYVRDEWAAPTGNDAVQVFSQETLLVIDAEEERLHGYAVTVTLAAEDRPALAPVVRQMLEGLRFPKR